MPFKIEILWTDAILFVLLLAIMALIIWQRRSTAPSPWGYVWRSRIGMCAFVVLFGYLTIAVLDSLHYRPALTNVPEEQGIVYSAQVKSVLDALVTPLDVQMERTYSAPFATQAFVKESISQPDGSVTYDYPPLTYAGTHLLPDMSKRYDIVGIMACALPSALIVWLGSLGLFFALVAGFRWTRFKALMADVFKPKPHGICWRTLIFTWGFVILTSVLFFYLSRYYHIFGTDKIGQDVFYQAIKSVRTGVMIGALTTLVMLPFALIMGTFAGYFRGWVDDVIQYIYTTLSSIPSVLLIAASILILEVFINKNPEWFASTEARADARLLALCIILGVTSWTSLCRLLRAETLKLRELDYVLAARSLGVRHFSIIGQHILPNVMHMVLITIALDFSSLVLAEAVLSYIGVGVDPSMQSFGNMINRARLELAREPDVWWSLAAAFSFMFILVLAANLFADTVRDAFDPRVRQAAMRG